MEEIKGRINKIIFQNINNNFKVVKIKLDDKNDYIVAAGKINNINIDDHLTIKGNFVNNEKYGLQFSIESFKLEETPSNKIIYETIEDLFFGLSKSKFRSGFKLDIKDINTIKEKGMDTIRQHAYEIIEKRIVNAEILNDGKQTPMRGHPVFKAMHATACCCRSCLFKWHNIKPGFELTKNQKDYVVNVIMEWIKRNYKE